MTETIPTIDRRPAPGGRWPADSAVAERLWDALYQARTGESHQLVAELEDAAFRFYLPMARTLAYHVNGGSEADRSRSE